MKNYMAYLLRIWSGNESETLVWRASLEDPHTRKLIQFAQISELTDFLQALTEPDAQNNPFPPSQETKQP